MSRYIVLLTVSLFACQPDASQNANLDALKDSISKFNTAFAAGDLETLDQMTPDDYVHTNGNSPSFGKQSWFDYLKTRKAQLENQTLKVETYEFLDQKIVLKNESAIVTGKVVSKGVRNGEAFSSEIRVSNFWILEGGVWKRAGFHDTRIN